MNINLEDDALTASTSDVSSRPTEEWLDTEELDLSTHFDVFVKYQYARAFLDGTLTDYHRRAYVEHLRVFNACLELGTDGEPVSCALGFSWTLDCERVLAGGVSR